MHTSTGAVSPLCLGGQHTSTLTVTITLETIAPLVAGLAIEVSPMSCHGGAVREERSGGKGRIGEEERGGDERGRQGRRRKEGKKEGEEGGEEERIVFLPMQLHCWRRETGKRRGRGGRTGGTMNLVPVQHLATLRALEAELVPLVTLRQHLLCHVHCLTTFGTLGSSSPLGHPWERETVHEGN